MGIPRPLYEFADLVRRMRAAQSAYFTTRSSAALIDAKSLEKDVDRSIAFILKPQPLASEFGSDEDTQEIVYCDDDCDGC